MEVWERVLAAPAISSELVSLIARGENPRQRSSRAFCWVRKWQGGCRKR